MSSSTKFADPDMSNIRRRWIWGTGSLAAQSFSGLINIPGLKDAALFAKETARAVKAPKWNDEEARKQINSIEGLLARVDAALPVPPAPHGPKSLLKGQGELDDIDSFLRDMETYKAELEKALSEKYTTKLARQNDIAQFLAQKNEQISERILDFCVDGGLRANHAILLLTELSWQIQALSMRLEGESQKVTNLEYQIQRLWRT